MPAEQHPLHRSPGSSLLTTKTHSLLASVSAPTEASRTRADENPETCSLEVALRPLSGVAGPRERCLERAVAGVLRTVVLGHRWPRLGVVVTVQVIRDGLAGVRGARGAKADVVLLAGALQAVWLALVDGGVPLRDSLATTVLAECGRVGVVVDPVPEALAEAESVSGFAVNQVGEVLWMESVGGWGGGEVMERARRVCLRALRRVGEDEMVEEEQEESGWLRRDLEAKAREQVAWRETT